MTYSQDEMNIVLERLRQANERNNEATRLIWAIVKAMGGRVSIPYRHLVTMTNKNEIVRWSDPAMPAEVIEAR